MENAIELNHITKTFGQTTAVRDFNLTVPQGALYGLIGPNGAGKTTIIRMILAILFPDSGELSVFGQSSIKDVRHRIGYLPEERGVYRKMRVGDFLAFMGQLKEMNDADIRRLVPEWLEKTGLSSIVKKRCEELSKGMQQKIQFITAVMHRPDILILDEPFSGLDPVNQRLLRDLVLEERRRGATILFSTHVMIHAEQLCDHIVMVYQGNKVLDGTPSEILKTSDSRRILFEPLDPSANVEKLRETPGVRDVQREGALWEITLSESARLAEVIPALTAAVVPAHIQIRRPTLEDIFVSIVTGEDGDPVLYTGIGLVALTTFALNGLVDPLLFVYLIVFFVVSYVTAAALMAAIGAAVNDLRDAQSMMAPVMMIFMLPYLLMFPVINQPNSLLSTVASFIPPIGNFVMMVRLSTNTPPPVWQVILAILIGAAGAYFALQLAAKVFRVGLLMFGKPPTFATLIRWIRMSN